MINIEIRLIIFFAAEDGEALYSQQDWEVSGSDQEVVIAKFRLKLMKIGKTTRSFRYNLNQIPYDYTAEMTNRFQGLDLMDKVPEELWTGVCDIVHEVVIKTIPKKRNAKRQNGCLRKPYTQLRKKEKQKAKEKRKDVPI